MSAPLVFATLDLSRAADANELLEARPCPLCGRDQRAVVEELAGFQFFTDDPGRGKRVDLRTVECRACGLLHLDPGYGTEALAVLFAEAGHSFGAGAARYDARAAWLLEHAAPAPDEGVLDLGCYEGALLSRLPDTGPRVGVDGDAGAVARGRARDPELDLRQADLGSDDALAAAREAGVLALFHVLEHLLDPLALLRRLRGAAREDARLVVEVPVLDSAPSGDVVGFFTPHHQTHFDAERLVTMLGVAGWDVVVQDVTDPNGMRVLAAPGEATRAVWRGGYNVVHLRRASEVRAGALTAYRRLAEVPPGPCVLWGAGNHTEMLLHRTDWFDADPDRPVALVDSDPAKQGRTWRGVPIAAPDALREVDWSATRLVVSSYRGTPAIARAALELGVPDAALALLYDPEDM